MLTYFFVLLVCANLCVGRDVTLRCGLNEEVQCTRSCPPEKTCRNRDIQLSCLQVVEQCRYKCVCKEGYARNFLGDCISYEKCDQCNGQNEFFACDSACDNECSTINKQNRTNCPIKNIMCNSGCYCDDGYARDANKNCIPQEKCQTPLKCGENEEIKCVRSCPPEKTCRNRHVDISCLAVVEPCQTKCVCKDGYFKNSLGACISEEQCEQCKGPNEFFSCGSDFDNECYLLEKQNRTNCPKKNIVCKPRCYCDDGYARDENGNCIPQEKCLVHSCPGINEVYKQCDKKCPTPQLCSWIMGPSKCDFLEPCSEPRCYCKPGYLRQDERSPCIYYTQCDLTRYFHSESVKIMNEKH